MSKIGCAVMLLMCVGCGYKGELVREKSFGTEASLFRSYEQCYDK